MDPGDPMDVFVSQIRSNEDHAVRKTVEMASFDEMIGGFEDHTASSALEVDLVFSRLQGDDILARGTLKGEVSGPCRRCLEAVRYPVDVDVVVTFVPAGRAAASDGDELDLEPDDLDVIAYEADAIRLDDLVRETVLLELTPFPPCDGSRASCSTTEAALDELARDEEPTDEADKPMDPRWAALMQLKNNESESN